MKQAYYFKPIYSGFTLLNLLVAIVIMGMLGIVGTPSLQLLVNNSQANSAYQQLFTIIQFTRIQSVNYSSQVILCPSINQRDCINDWNQELIVFVDINNDETFNENELLLQTKNASRNNENIYWRASGSLRYLRFKADGSTRNQNGRLTYCLEKSGNIYARQIIMYRTGRARKASESEALSRC